jgi:hypothetical protein
LGEHFFLLLSGSFRQAEIRPASGGQLAPIG